MCLTASPGHTAASPGHTAASPGRAAASPGCTTPQGPGHLAHIEHEQGGGHRQPGSYEARLSRELKSCPTDVKEERLELRNDAFQLGQKYVMDLSTNFAT